MSLTLSCPVKWCHILLSICEHNLQDKINIDYQLQAKVATSRNKYIKHGIK